MRFDRIVLTGGGSQQRAWRQMVADVFGLPVEVPAQAEGAAFGAALQALWAQSHRAAGEGAILPTGRASTSRMDPALRRMSGLRAACDAYASRTGASSTTSTPCAQIYAADTPPRLRKHSTGSLP